MAGSGAGSRLPTPILVLAGTSTFVAVIVSAMSIHLQLRNYRKPSLQRMVVRIMLMVPIYAIASLISLFSVEAAFVIDAIRDIYEAFVIYCFFVLLLSYLGGERSLLIMLHGRPPKQPVFPINLFKSEIDVSDPYTFLFLKRGILQYVQVKPILAAVTLILKACGKFNEGDFRANSGYLYVSIIYNASICLALYCLAMFWVCINDDLKPFRPVPKFLCVKGILFFSFWQSVGISVLVAAKVITKLGPYTDPENVSVGLNDTLICVEMPFFAMAHLYAFSYKDYIDPLHTFVARMPMYYAFRDAFGLLDVVQDTKTTLRGEGMDYREFEPAEGHIHQGAGRDRRIRAGLRYSKGGQKKYWLPKTTTEAPNRAERAFNRIAGNDSSTTPFLARDADDIVHLAPDLNPLDEEETIWDGPDQDNGYGLPFGDIDEADEELFAHSKKYLFGDYNYPCIDVSSESAKTVIWDEEERVLRNERGAWFSPLRGAKGQVAIQRRERPAWEGYGAVSNAQSKGHGNGKGQQRFYDDDDDGKVIDYDQDRSPPAEAKDVIMKWTKVQRRDSRSKNPGVLGASMSNSSSSSHANRVRSPPSVSRTTSKTAGPVLPSDAVDLVVEDHSAAEDERVRERRKGHPGSQVPGLRRVYRRGIEGGEHPHVEVEVEETNDEADGRRRVDVGNEIVDVIGYVSSDDDDEGKRTTIEHLTKEVKHVARAVTPPLHARISGFQYDIPDDNPWA